ncbi:MAG: HigA family addiction module antitoxin [Anaerococcus vaginalis]|uniref:HigA family addiction module antitoxin n=1 Tax=Anaerococcus vaginalis TaxID=33037 RepID=UPI002910BFA0|nr:HigA family addiction module antitoxin [Anaerococcus vaginalis]MDU7650449.1 HigA family addiction module antitoxin [Anaerococcus vaginalis]
MSNNLISYEELIAFHPGSYIEDIIDELNITQDEFAKRMGVSSKTISKIVNGKANITDILAEKLSRFTGISFKTWMNLQASYNKKVIEIKNKMALDEEKEIAKEIDFNYFKKELKIIEDKTYRIDEKIEFLRRFLNISSLSYLKDFNSNVSYRNNKFSSDINEKSIIKSNVMLEIAINEARKKADKSLDINKLKSKLNDLKSLINSNDKVYEKLEENLLECGIILVTLPYFKGSNLNGAVYKFNNGSVLLLITDKQKRLDIFWFTLLHEIGHIINKDFNSNLDENEYDCNENKADKFAQDFLINPISYKKFVENHEFDRESLEKFAKDNLITSDIVVGRLKNDCYIRQELYNNYNKFMKIPKKNIDILEDIAYYIN